jgi:predicted nucleotidyltransferase
MADLKDPELKVIVESLKDEFKPSRLFLFGSRANGTARADSDYDFVVVVPETKKNRIDNMARAQSAIRKVSKASADVFVYSQEEFDDWKEEFSSIPETALNTGLEIDLG